MQSLFEQTDKHNTGKRSVESRTVGGVSSIQRKLYPEYGSGERGGRVWDG